MTFLFLHLTDKNLITEPSNKTQNMLTHLTGSSYRRAQNQEETFL